MGKRKVSILEPAATAVAEIAFFIESKGLPATAKKFVDEAFAFFDELSDDRIERMRCRNRVWKRLGYKCITYKKKYVIAFLSLENEIVICDFVASKLLR
ncbi:MAG: ParE toxin of type toxin-antitoxin system, parDE [Segetibacter sp.]|nr:ParE toxin of type toxin-antitoxin system, parDE [Segetibacter sp.]